MSKKRNFFRGFILLVAPPFLWIFLRLIYFSCRKRFHIPRFDFSSKNYIYTFWHGDFFIWGNIYKRVNKHGSISVMASKHFDGEIISRVMSFFGIKTIRGSNSRGSIGMLKSALKNIDDGLDIGITPDGPRGPKHSISNGIIFLSKKKEIDIVACRYSASSYWKLKSWDGFIIPKPFSKLNIFVSLPFSIRDVDENKAKSIIKNKLLADVS